eukprot:gene33856-40960_t
MSAPESKFTLKKIPSQLQRDIDCCLFRYFKNTSKLSSIYWPRALRSFLAVLLNKAKSMGALLDKPQWEAWNLSCIIIASLSDQFWSTIEISSDPQPWPGNIANYLDLNTALSFIQMRRDVSAYLHYIMSIASGGKVGYKISFCIPDTEPDESVQQFYPIRIYTDNDECTTRAREMFAAESEKLKQSVYNLLPTDLVCVETTAQALSAGLE